MRCGTLSAASKHSDLDFVKTDKYYHRFLGKGFSGCSAGAILGNWKDVFLCSHCYLGIFEDGVSCFLCWQKFWCRRGRTDKDVYPLTLNGTAGSVLLRLFSASIFNFSKRQNEYSSLTESTCRSLFNLEHTKQDCSLDRQAAWRMGETKVLGKRREETKGKWSPTWEKGKPSPTKPPGTVDSDRFKVGGRNRTDVCLCALRLQLRYAR